MESNGPKDYCDLITDLAPAGIAVFDQKMNYLDFSQQWLTMFDLSSDILGKSHYDVFPNVKKHLIESHQRGLRGETVDYQEDEHTKLNGMKVWHSWSIKPWMNKQREVGGIIIFVKDITAEKKLRERKATEEKKFRAIFDQAAIGICQFDLEGKFISVNQKFCDITHYNKEELIFKKTFVDITHPNDKKTWIQLATAALKSEISCYEVDKRYITKSGKTIWVHLTVSVVRDEKENPAFFVSTVQDITKNKHDEAAIKLLKNDLDKKVNEKTAYLALLQKISSVANQSDNVSESLQLCLKEVCNLTHWEIGHFSPVYSDNTYDGMTHVWELKDTTLYDDFVKSSQSINTTHESIINRVIKTGKPFWSNDIFYDFNFYRSNIGKHVGIKSGMAFPVLTGSRVVGVLEFFTNKNIHPSQNLMDLMEQLGIQLGRLIERKISTEQIKLTQSRLQAIIDNIPARIYLKDDHGRYLMVNRTYEDYFGANMDDLQGKTAYDIFDKTDADVFTLMDEEILTNRKIVSQEIQYGQRDKRDFLLIKFPVTDYHNHIYGLGGISIDITEERQNKLKMQQLLESEHLARIAAEDAISDRDEFISIASHELKSPITSLKLKVQLLIKLFEKDSEIIDETKIILALKKIYGDADRLVFLIGRLLDLTRIQTGKFELMITPLDINKLIQNIIDSQFIGQDLPSITLTSHSSITGEWDFSRMEQVIVNLISNAIKFGNKRPISITTKQEGENLVLEVIDQGIGIAESDTKLIFNRFERGGAKNNVHGLGLGLYIVKQIIEAHGGSISANSKIREGTTFRIVIPLHPVYLNAGRDDHGRLSANPL